MTAVATGVAALGSAPPNDARPEGTPLVRDISIAELRTDGGTQPRASTDHKTVDEYAEAMNRGETFPPVIVFHDGRHAWIADGFHRVLAANKLGRKTISAEIRKGTVRDATLFCVGANATHGKPRSNSDKRRAVTVLLNDKEWAQWSDHAIAKRCAVHQTFVSKLRNELTPTTKDKHQSHGATRAMRRCRDGKMRNVSNVGRISTASKASPSTSTKKTLRADETNAKIAAAATSEQLADSRVELLAVVDEDVIANVTTASKIVTQRPRGRRSPKKEEVRVNAIVAAVKNARHLWRHLEIEWNDHHRFDMLWAVRSSPDVLEAFDVAIGKLEAIAIRCTTEGTSSGKRAS